MPRNAEFNIQQDAPTQGDRRQDCPTWKGPGAAGWIGGWFTVFTAVLLANLLTVAILVLAAPAYLSHRIKALEREVDRTEKELKEKLNKSKEDFEREINKPRKQPQ